VFYSRNEQKNLTNYCSIQHYFQTLGAKGTIRFMRHLLISLQACHKNSIIHCDIKPANCLYNLAEDSFSLVDFGLSECLTKAHMGPQTNRFGTKGFRAPELLLAGRQGLETANDIWSAGVILLSILAGRYPFFNSVDDHSAIAEHVHLFGYEPMLELAKKYGVALHASREVMQMPPQDLKLLCEDLNKASSFAYPDELYDLLTRLMDVNPKTRITASEALQHPCFHNVK